MKKFPAKLEIEAVNVTILEESIDEGTKEKTMRVQMKWQHGNIINRNGRRYRSELLKREIDRIQEQVVSGEIYGASYHPVGGDAEINDVSHIWNKVWIDEDGQCYGEATVLPTRTGKDAMVLIKHGRVGVSSRGAGTVTKKIDVVDGKKQAFDEVNDDFRLLSPGDFVLSPSVPDARVRAVMENSISDTVDSYVKENIHLFIESQDEPEGSKSKTKEDDMDKYESIEAMKADHEELFKTYEEGLSAEMVRKQVEAELAKAKAEWTKATEKKLDKAVEAVKKSNETMVEGIRDAINVLTTIEGVIPEEENPTPEDEGKAKKEDLSQTIADLKAKNDELTAEITKRDTAETDAKDKEKAQSNLRVALDAELAKAENEKFKDLLEEELVRDGEITIKTVEEVAEVVKTARDRISKIVTEGVKNKILESGTAPKGKVTEEDVPSEKDAEEKITIQFTEAKKAGFKGTKDEFKSKVLGL